MKYVRIYRRKRDGSLTANIVSSLRKKKGKAIKTIRIR